MIEPGLNSVRTAFEMEIRVAEINDEDVVLHSCLATLHTTLVLVMYVDNIVI